MCRPTSTEEATDGEAGAVAAARRELAAAFLGDLRRIDAQLLDAKKKLTVAPFTSNLPGDDVHLTRTVVCKLPASG